MRAVTFQVRAPELHLNDGLSAISRKILSGTTGQYPVRLDERAAELFRPHLESDWGLLYSALPNFFSQFARGHWRGNDQQHLPTTLVGDFGEFLTARVLRRLGATRVTRVIRAASLARPDFIAYFPARAEVIAVEVKSGAVNASRLEETTRSAILGNPDNHHQFNLCALLRDRRSDGIAQLHGLTVRPRGQLPPSRNPLDLGQARVPAHRSAVATPYFIDGRVAHAGKPWHAHSTPRACKPTRCMECVASGAGGPLPVLLPIFYNSKVILRPLLPPDDHEHYVQAHTLATSAVWTGSEALFRSAWKQLAFLLVNARVQRDSAQAATSHLLDVLAAGVEADLVPDVGGLMKEALLTNDELGPVVDQQINEAASMSPGDMRPTLGRKAAPPIERWEKFWLGRPRTRKRNRRKLPALGVAQRKELRDWVDQTAGAQKSPEATLDSPDAAICWLPSGTDEQREFRIAAKEERAAHELAMTALELLIPQRSNAQRAEDTSSSDGVMQHVVVRDGVEIIGEALISNEGTAIVRVLR